MVCGKKILYESVACVCLTFGIIFLVIAFFMAIEFLMSVMNISFALPVDLHKSLSNSENGSLQRFYFKRFHITSIITMTV